MISRGRSGARLFLALVVLALGPGFAPPAAADEGTSRTYAGPAYSPEIPGSPTQSEGQSKLWFHSDAWWALLAEPTGTTVRVFELMPDHTWRPTSAAVNVDATQVGDALPDGDAVHVVTRSGTGSLQYAMLTFDAAARDYKVETKQIATVRGGNAAPSITKDTAGRLWVGYANGLFAAVTYSDDGLTWAEPIEIARTGDGSEPELATMVAYDDRVGLMWSNQTSDSFEFASHRAGDDPAAWSREQALAGEGEADNHISLVHVPGDPGATLVAAVKTSQDEVAEDAGQFLIKVLIRDPDGTWSQVPAATISDELTDPLLQVDVATRTLHLFAASESGDITVKRTSFDDIRFKPGLGDLFVLAAEGRLVNPTGSKAPVDARSGVVVLADDTRGNVYRHGEAPVGGASPVAPSDDETPPDPPAGLRAGAVTWDTVVLSWTRGANRDRWFAAGDAPPVSGYAVSRNGVEIESLTSTSLRDNPRTGPETGGASVEYSVQAVDESGNRSDPVSVTVTLPPAPSRLPAYLGIAALALAGLGAGYRAFRRSQVRRRRATAETTGSPERALSSVGDRTGS